MAGEPAVVQRAGGTQRRGAGSPGGPHSRAMLPTAHAGGGGLGGTGTGVQIRSPLPRLLRLPPGPRGRGSGRGRMAEQRRTGHGGTPGVPHSTAARLSTPRPRERFQTGGCFQHVPEPPGVAGEPQSRSTGPGLPGSCVNRGRGDAGDTGGEGGVPQRQERGRARGSRQRGCCRSASPGDEGFLPRGARRCGLCLPAGPQSLRPLPRGTARVPRAHPRPPPSSVRGRSPRGGRPWPRAALPAPGP